jgi:hypothetical protein
MIHDDSEGFLVVEIGKARTRASVIFVPICIYSFYRCYTWFGDYPNYMQIKFLLKELVKVLNENKKIKKQIGTTSSLTTRRATVEVF